MAKCEFKLSKKIPISRIIGLAILAIAVGFFTKIWLWENSYYAEKNGSERVAAVNTSENAEPEVDETVPTEQEIVEYTVAPDLPRYLSIPSIGVSKSRVLALGLTSSGALSTPISIFDAGWYYNSGKPGAGGTMVIDGHNGGPTMTGIFKRLPEVPIGESVIIERGDGAVFEYKVVENNTIPLSEADNYMSVAMTSPESGKEALTIITCTGGWIRGQATYDSRQFLRAVLVEKEPTEEESEE